MEFDISEVKLSGITSASATILKVDQQSDKMSIDCNVGFTMTPKWIKLKFNEFDSLVNSYSQVVFQGFVPYNRKVLNKDLNYIRFNNKVSSDTLYIEMKLN